MLKVFLFILMIIIFPSIHTTDYCKMCKNKSHTMCKYKGRAKSCINYNSSKMTPKIQAIIENFHNEQRNKVGSGEESKGAPGPQPAATNMLLMKWDNELSRIAQRWADQCRSPSEENQHDDCKLTKRFDVGQNVIQVIRGKQSLEFETIVKKMIQRWYDEVNRVGSDQIKEFKGADDPDTEIGHYTQIIWAETKYIGCGHASFIENITNSAGKIIEETVDTFVCNYGPTGNILGAPVYKIGKPCSICKCTEKYSALCEDTEQEINEVKGETKTETKREAKGDTKTTKTEATPKQKVSVETENRKLVKNKPAETTNELTTETEATFEVSTPFSEYSPYRHHHLKGEKCPFESLRTRFRLLHRDGDECYCLYRVKDSAKQLLPEIYLLLYLLFFILYYF